MISKFLPIALVVLVASCASNETSDSANVKQSEIYQNYDIYWVKGEGSVTASFRFGGPNGTTLRLSKPSAITLNDKNLSETKFLLGGVYYYAGNLPLSENNLFKFTDTDGKTYENGLSFKDVEFVKAPRSISQKENLVLALSRPIQPGEVISLNAESDTTASNEVNIGIDSASSAYFDSKTNSLVVKPEFFQGFSDVPVTIWMEHFEEVKPLKQPSNLGGEIRLHFQSKLIDVKRLDGKKGKPIVSK